MQNTTYFKHLTIIVGFTGSLLLSYNIHAAEKGKSVYESVCRMCHQTGVMGAPKFGNKEDWAARIAKGKETLYQHALHGFKGQKGTMPPKGGKPQLADDDVKAAVDYFVANATK
jgi:cytochrome c5